MARRNSHTNADQPNLRAPTQSRSRETTEALLAIGKRLIAEHGVDGCNMPDVAAAAGSSVGALYFRFGNKEKFVSEVMKRHADQSRTDLAKVLARAEASATSPSDVINAMTAWVVNGARRNEGLLRAQLRRALEDPQEWEPFRSLGRDAVDGTISLLGRFPELHKDPEWQRHVRIAMQMIFGTVNNALINRPGPLHLDSPDMSSDLSDAALRSVGWERNSNWVRPARRRTTR